MAHDSLIRVYAKYIERCKLSYGLDKMPLAFRKVRKIAFYEALKRKADQLVLFASGKPGIDIQVFKEEIYNMLKAAIDEVA